MVHGGTFRVAAATSMAPRLNEGVPCASLCRILVGLLANSHPVRKCPSTVQRIRIHARGLP
jgi:hypothetical protein